VSLTVMQVVSLRAAQNAGMPVLQKTLDRAVHSSAAGVPKAARITAAILEF